MCECVSYEGVSVCVYVSVCQYVSVCVRERVCEGVRESLCVCVCV